VTQAQPHTAGSLAADFRALGLLPGDTVLAHTSLRAIGFVAGSAQAVVQAILDALGPEGTLVVPTHTTFNSDPAGWRNPPVPAAWWPIIRAESPGFAPAVTPSWAVGAIPEIVRAWPGTRRSNHPQTSFAAIGAWAEAVVGTHPLEHGFGEASPLGAVYRRRGKVLLLGCGHDRNTSMHLAEFRQERPPMVDYGASVRQPDGASRWVTWIAPDADSSDFGAIGAAYEKTGAVTVGRVGEAVARLMPQPGVVDFATDWIRRFR
jgi:aminoglycoside 3-N-acetyltransferase